MPLPAIPDDSPKVPLQRGQTSIARLLAGVILAGLLFRIVARYFQQGRLGIGEILTIVLVATVIFGAAIGLMQGGTEMMFKGMVVALMIFFAALMLLSCALPWL